MPTFSSMPYQAEVGWHGGQLSVYGTVNQIWRDSEKQNNQLRLAFILFIAKKQKAELSPKTDADNR